MRRAVDSLAVVAAAGVLGPLDSYVVCERVTRNGALDRDDCFHVDNAQAPRQAVWDLLDQLPL